MDYYVFSLRLRVLSLTYFLIHVWSACVAIMATIFMPRWRNTVYSQYIRRSFCLTVSSIPYSASINDS